MSLVRLVHGVIVSEPAVLSLLLVLIANHRHLAEMLKQFLTEATPLSVLLQDKVLVQSTTGCWRLCCFNA
jgi:hypothetical protein